MSHAYFLPPLFFFFGLSSLFIAISPQHFSSHLSFSKAFLKHGLAGLKRDIFRTVASTAGVLWEQGLGGDIVKYLSVKHLINSPFATAITIFLDC